MEWNIAGLTALNSHSEQEKESKLHSAANFRFKIPYPRRPSQWAHSLKTGGIRKQHLFPFYSCIQGERNFKSGMTCQKCSNQKLNPSVIFFNVLSLLCRVPSFSLSCLLLYSPVCKRCCVQKALWNKHYCSLTSQCWGVGVWVGDISSQASYSSLYTRRD